MKISQNGIFYFLYIFFAFLVLSPFFMFQYFLYFESTSQHIMNINTPNWSLELVEYIKYKGILHRLEDILSAY